MKRLILAMIVLLNVNSCKEQKEITNMHILKEFIIFIFLLINVIKINFKKIMIKYFKTIFSFSIII